MNQAIGFIGTGQMATALATGFLKTNTLKPNQLFGYDISTAALLKFAAATGGTAADSVKSIVGNSQIVFLSVKPQQMNQVLHEIEKVHLPVKEKLWITIAAGLPLATYLKELGTAARIVRVMPNTPCLVGEGALGFCASEGATAEDKTLAKELLETVGFVAEFPERQLNAVTGLSGSGPAIVYMLIEAMADGGVKMGLARNTAQNLAAQTVLGSAKVVLQTGEHPGALKDKVCSPRGTTIYGVHSLEKDGFRSAVINAVEAATRRSNELGSE
ncbi:MAG: pyrroline-5-carboxylate reductase [Planctomycetaceae bacterium]|jgi:pyrroline-5-carboxylate reductase|nr:pyrroline-5-carboxylate reductase [Planctomycetaceae bacterium]